MISQYRESRWINTEPAVIEPGAEHVFVLYHSHRKSFWKTRHLNDALHLYAYLTTVGAEFKYEVWSPMEAYSDA